MKRTRLGLTVGSILLTCAMAVNLTGCAKRVQAEDLTAGIEPTPVAGKAADEAFIRSQLRLSAELFRASVKESGKENVLISPLSIQLALAMTANGADGRTRTEMEALLGGDIALEELNEYLYSYVKALPSADKYKLKLANSIWFRDDEKRLKVEQDFLQANADYYGAQAYKAAFDKQTLRDINNWVDIHTDGEIDQILTKIDPDAVLYLVNTLLFDAEWADVYEKRDIYDGEFTAVSGEKKTVKMMRSDEYQYLDDGKATGFIKSYKDGKYSFAALLPNEGTDIQDYIAGLTGESLENILKNVQNETVKAILPKFRYEYELQMNNVLAGLGMPTAFSEDEADFTKMATSVRGNIFIADVLHKTFITIDARGTKAGAVTKVEMRDAMAPMEPKTVRLDRPFVYLILDNTNSVCLPVFIGAVMDI